MEGESSGIGWTSKKGCDQEIGISEPPKQEVTYYIA
jgi:hypothetical protein